VASATAAAAILGALPATAIPATTVTLAVPVAPVTNVAPVLAAAPAAPTRAASSAVSHAMGKIGAPYRWGAEGPSAFDCSGLVQWSFKKAGINLPRTSQQQSGVGTPVGKSDLRPGDLVFFHRPVSHVGIYIGGGKIVHASNKKSPVKISDLSRMPSFNSARRVS
jgi:cell wall-associated NlpC family hydrolase